MNDFHNDYDLLYVLYKNYEGNKRVVLLDTSDWSIFDCIQFLNGLDFLISMRMHPIIFKVIGKSKKHSFIAISHIHKFEGLLDDLKCSNRLISIKELTLKCLIEKFSEVSKNEKILGKELDLVKQRISEVIDNIIIENYNKKFNLMLK
jgi:polysaccharide pyruvyl transferase WcaK-like protein